jgi:CRP-like cAMP-binding protein
VVEREAVDHLARCILGVDKRVNDSSFLINLDERQDPDRAPGLRLVAPDGTLLGGLRQLPLHLANIVKLRWSAPTLRCRIETAIRLVSPLILRLETYVPLPEQDRASIDLLATRSVREVPARRDLLREGELPRALILILEGWACRYKALPDGRRQIVAFLVPGDLCNHHFALQRAMDHSIGAITPIKVAELPRDEFARLAGERAPIAEGLTWDQLVEVAVQREWTLNVGQRTAFERISHLLCEMFLRLRAVGLTSGDSCDFPLTQADIADAAGLTAVHVNRTLQDLRREGLIELQNRTLTIPDLDALMAAGMFNPNYLNLARRAG